MGGKTIRQGQRVFAFMNSANRDPAAVDDPERFDIGRPANPHLTFGHGIHFCLGAPLARLEARIAALRLAERLPALSGFAGGEPEPGTIRSSCAASKRCRSLLDSNLQTQKSSPEERREAVRLEVGLVCWCSPFETGASRPPQE